MSALVSRWTTRTGAAFFAASAPEPEAEGGFDVDTEQLDGAGVDADGYLYFKGRRKRIIKVSGVSVYPAQVEPVQRSGRAEGLDETGDGDHFTHGRRVSRYVPAAGGAALRGAVAKPRLKRALVNLVARSSHWKI